MSVPRKRLLRRYELPGARYDVQLFNRDGRAQARDTSLNSKHDCSLVVGSRDTKACLMMSQGWHIAAENMRM